MATDGRYPPPEYWRWRLARETGWSLEYVDGLPLSEWHEYFQVSDGEDKARNLASDRARRAAQTARRGRRR